MLTTKNINKYDCFLFVFHDQALIPFKYISKFSGVNFIYGLYSPLFFDIFIASSELDRDVGEFAALIAQCQQARQSIETQATVHVQD